MTKSEQIDLWRFLQDRGLMIRFISSFHELTAVNYRERHSLPVDIDSYMDVINYRHVMLSAFIWADIGVRWSTQSLDWNSYMKGRSKKPSTLNSNTKTL